MIPADERRDIRKFIERYFVEDVLVDAPVTDEKARIVYYETEGAKLYDNRHITKKHIEFDIYVRGTEVYTADVDRLRRRDKLIAQRLKELLTGKEHVRNMRYAYEDDYTLGSKIIGYRRWHIVFSYKTTN